MSDRCSKPVWNNIVSYPCGNKGSVEELGRWWCRIHAPSVANARRKASRARYEAKWAAIRAAGAVKRYSIEELRPYVIAWDVGTGPYQERDLIFKFFEWLESQDV